MASSSYQEARACHPAMCSEVEKQKHLVNSTCDSHREGSEMVGTMWCKQQWQETGLYHLGGPLDRWLESCPMEKDQNCSG